MGRPRYTYAVEVPWPEDWRPIIDAETRDFCLGYLAAHRQHPGPRVAVREATAIQRQSPGNEVSEVDERDEREVHGRGAGSGR